MLSKLKLYKRFFCWYVTKPEPEYKTYICKYWYAGEKWTVEIRATSLGEAHHRLGALERGKIVGELKASIPVGNWLSRLFKR